MQDNKRMFAMMLHDTTKPARTAQERKAKLEEIDKRYRAKAKKIARESGAPQTKPSHKAMRAAELERFFKLRYGGRLPEDDAGREDAKLMVHHLHPDAAPSWLRRWAPWMNALEVECLIVEAERVPRWWKADELGIRIGLTRAERTDLRITTIGAVDFLKPQRIKERKQRNRLAKREKRARKGAKPHAESLSRTQPWLAQGISRATWYRRKNGASRGTKRRRETDSGTAYFLGKGIAGGQICVTGALIASVGWSVLPQPL
jgi:hypothetical protein